MQDGAGHIQYGADGAVTLWIAARDAICADAARLVPMLTRLGVIEPPSADDMPDWPITITGWSVPMRLVGGVAAHDAFGAVRDGHDAPHIMGLSLGPVDLADRPRAVQAIAHVASLIASVVDAQAIFWPPANLWSNVSELPHAVAAMERSGMPPILHFVQFSAPKPGEMVTEGLAWLAGHELAATMPADMTAAEGVRRLARFSIDLMLNGPMAGDVVIAGLARGERIHIRLPHAAGEPIRLALTTSGGRQ